MTSPPTPFHVLRTHHAAISCLAFSENSTLLYAGDQDGFVSVTDLKGRRVVRYWKAHEGGVLSVAEWDGKLISHGRDNVIHVYQPIPRLRLTLTSGPSPSSALPDIDRSLPTNSLNFCRFALLPISHHSAPASRRNTSDRKGKGKGRADRPQALLAVPSLVDSETADIYLLPELRRLHASVNAPDPRKAKRPAEDGKVRSGLIMGLQLGFVFKKGSASTLGLVIGFEDGRVEKWELPTNVERSESDGESSPRIFNETAPPWVQFSDGKGAIGPRLWTLAWEGKGHNEAVMALAATRDLSRAFSVSADHQLAVYDLMAPHNVSTPDNDAKGIALHSVKQIGNASVALAPDEAVVAVGGWDGKTRLFSAATGKPLGTLPFHRDTIQAIAFPFPPGAQAPMQPGPIGDMEDSQSVTADEVSVDETMEIGQSSSSDSGDDDADDAGHANSKRNRRTARWMATGGKDTKIALWELKDFGARRASAI